MKKRLLLLALVFTVLNVSANRKWDFTSWSAATVANLNAGCYATVNGYDPASGWSDVESSSKFNDTYAASKDNCFWEVTAQGDAAQGATVKANGVTIAELDGLLYTNTAARSLAIALNYPTTSLGNYHGGAYLWLGGKQKNYFVIPDVKPGAVISMGVESHKPSEGRGVELYVVKKGTYGTKGTKLTAPDGSAVSVPSTYTDQSWLVPEEGLTDEPNEDGTYDILIYNTNGCHLYYINVAEAGDVVEERNVAWVSPFDNPENDDTYRMFAPTDGFNYTYINSTAEGLTAEALRAYDAVVISNGVTEDDAAYSVLKDNIAYVPMVNLNTNIFGYQNQETDNVQLEAQVKTNALFENSNMDEETGIFEYTNVAVTLPEQFANDLVLAKNGDYTAFHQHGTNRNVYILLPSTEDVDFDSWTTFLTNALNVVAATKKEIIPAATPSVSLAYADGKTTATVTCGTANSVIYVSTDGENYSEYTAPIEFTAAGTIYAYAEAEGYTQGEKTSKDVDIKTQMATPTISQTHATNSTTISFSAAEGAKVYFSFVKDTDPAKMALYTEPVTISEPATVYALATSDAMLPSELATAVVNIDSITSETIRLDTLAHMDCNQAEYFDAVSAYCTENYGGTGSASAFYYFGKNAWNYYQLNDDGTIKKDSVEVEGEWQYTYYPNEESLKTIDFQNGWIMKTNGQPATIECIDGPAQVGNGNTGRYADNVTDLVAGGPTKGLIDFGGKKDGEPYTLSIETTEKYQGPFDVVAYLGNGSTKEIDLKAQVSVDGKEWTTIGNLAYSSNQRYWKRSRLSYEGTEEVYVRVTGGGSKPQLYDIYLLNNGELSKQWKPKADAILGDVNGDDEITMADANMVVNYYLTPSNYPNFPVAQADMNNDNDITMADANAIVNLYLAGSKQ